jgi:hypothetical protein
MHDTDAAPMPLRLTVFFSCLLNGFAVHILYLTATRVGSVQDKLHCTKSYSLLF